MYHYTELVPKINTYCFFKLSTRKIRSDDLGVEVVILDYNNQEAFIPITEINRKKFNISTFFKSETVYPGIIYLIDNKRIMISYSKIKEEKREKLLKNFEIQTKFVNLINKIKTQYPSHDIINPVEIDFVDGDYEQLAKLYKETLLEPEKLSTNIEIKNFIIQHRKLNEPIYQQLFTLTVIETNGNEILKSILNKINNEFNVKIISSPLYAVEFNNINQCEYIKEKIESNIKNYDCLFEITNLITIKELEVEFLL